MMIPPMVTLESEFLYEIGCTAKRGLTVTENLAGRIGLKICDAFIRKNYPHALW